jgi:transcriptional regulator with GAF, ATPase, and Fis domain
MSAIFAELLCFGGARTARDRIADILVREGVIVVRADSGSARSPVLLAFEQVDEEVCAAIQQQASEGAHRVIALALKREKLNTQGTWRLMETGAADVLVWDAQPPPIAALTARLQRYVEVDELLESPFVREQLVGCSLTWRRTLREVVEVARFTDASVLLTGESGTGKELVARLIYTLDARPYKRELVVLDCTTVSAELAGSEFFGHERGAFTHAIQARDGAFALADGGGNCRSRYRRSCCVSLRSEHINVSEAIPGRKSISV